MSTQGGGLSTIRFISSLPTLLSLVLLFLPTYIVGIGAPPRGNSILVIGETNAVKDTHSILIDSLKSAGRKVNFVSATAKTIALESEGEYLYDGVILLAPRSTTLQNKLSVSQLIKFIDNGNDVFIASSTGYSTYTEKVAEALGIDLDDKENVMIDHQRSDSSTMENVSSDSDASWILGGELSKQAFPSQTINNGDASHVRFYGVGATLFKDNELVMPLMWASGSSFGRRKRASRNIPLGRIPRVAGAGAVLAAAVGTRTGSRGTWFGSFDALSNAAFNAAGEKHEQTMKRLVLWSMGEYGMIRMTKIAHTSENNIDNDMDIDEMMMMMTNTSYVSPSEYRVKDIIHMAITVETWNGDDGAWEGFKTDDIQMEFVMMNPWVRTRLHLYDETNGIYHARLQVPDQIGVYKFKFEYIRKGISPLFFEQVIPVRPYLHNEYERFIQMATPYYIASFSMIFGVFLLGLVLLYGGDTRWENVNDVREKTE